MRPVATDVWRGLSIGRSCNGQVYRYPAKTAGPIEMSFGMWGGVGRSNHVLDGGLDPFPPGEGEILGDFFLHWIALQTERSLPLLARWRCGTVINVSKYEAKQLSLGVGIYGRARACLQSVYSTRRCGLLSNYFDLLLHLLLLACWNAVSLITNAKNMPLLWTYILFFPLESYTVSDPVYWFFCIGLD